MRLRPRQGLLVGVAILAAGSVVLEIAIARTISAISGPHLALAAPTLALGGAGLGGAILGALPSLVRRRALLARMTTLSGLAAATALAAVLVLVHVRLPDVLDRSAVKIGLLLYLTSGLPFLVAGLALAAAFRHVPALTARLVLAVFAGAGLSLPLAFGAVRAGGPRAALVALGMYALAALCFYLGARGVEAQAVQERPRGAPVATYLLAAAVLLAGDLGAPWLKIQSQRFSPLDKVEAQEWSLFGLIGVDKPQGGINWIRTDGTAAVPLYDAKTAVPVAPDEMPYVLLRDQGPVAILGGGAGREVRIAVRYGHKQIDAVDLDPVLVRTFMLDHYKKASGDVYDSPGVKVSLDAGRGFVRRAAAPYRLVLLALPDTQAAQAAGVFAAEPADLFSVEAFADILDHLTPDGILAVTRLDAEADRLVVLAATALRAVGHDGGDPQTPGPAGVAAPEQHLYACSNARTTTLLVRKAPLTGSDAGLLRSFCRRNKLNEAFAPDQPLSEIRRRLDPELDGPTRVVPAVKVAADPPRTDLRPPTGDRPFFSSVIPPDLWLQTLLDKAAARTAQAVLVLWGVLGLAVALVFFSVGIPLSAWPRWPVGRMRPLLFFFGLGGALGFAGTALAPRLTVLMGHPLYGYTTVVPSLLASLGVGALLVEGVRPRHADAAAGIRAELLVAVLALAAVALDPLVEIGAGLPFGLRFLGALLVLVPVGALAGSLLAIGLREVAVVSPALVPWGWGMAAVGAFVAVALALPAAMALGYSATLLGAGLSALVAAACVPRAPAPAA